MATASLGEGVGGPLPIRSPPCHRRYTQDVPQPAGINGGPGATSRVLETFCLMWMTARGILTSSCQAPHNRKKPRTGIVPSLSLCGVRVPRHHLASAQQEGFLYIQGNPRPHLRPFPLRRFRTSRSRTQQYDKWVTRVAWGRCHYRRDSLLAVLDGPIQSTGLGTENYSSAACLVGLISRAPRIVSTTASLQLRNRRTHFVPRLNNRVFFKRIDRIVRQAKRLI